MIVPWCVNSDTIRVSQWLSEVKIWELFRRNTPSGTWEVLVDDGFAVDEWEIIPNERNYERIDRPMVYHSIGMSHCRLKWTVMLLWAIRRMIASYQWVVDMIEWILHLNCNMFGRSLSKQQNPLSWIHSRAFRRTIFGHLSLELSWWRRTDCQQKYSSTFFSKTSSLQMNQIPP
jgi:hypothetical protein